MRYIEKIPSHIKVRDRVRQDLGDMDSLKASIEKHTLLESIVISEDGYLIAGFRRLQVFLDAKWPLIPCRVIEGVTDLLAFLDMEIEENECRKEFTTTERVRMGMLRENLIREMAAGKKPSKAGVKPTAGTVNLPVPVEAGLDAGTPFDGAAKAAAKSIGMTPQTYAKAKEVAKAAEESPETMGDLPAKMDKEGVAPAARAMKERTAPTTKKDRMPDAAGVEVPALLRDLFGDRWLDEADAGLREAKKIIERVTEAAKKKAGLYRWIDAAKTATLFEDLATAAGTAETSRLLLQSGKPSHVCDFCKGKGTTPDMEKAPQKCTDCRGHGYLPLWRYKELYEDK